MRKLLFVCAALMTGCIGYFAPPTVEQSFVPSEAFAVKTSDESVASSTVLQDDDALITNVKAGQRYRLRATLFMTEVASGMKIALGGTCTVTSLKAQIAVYDGVLRAMGRVTALDSAVVHGTAGGGEHYILVDGVVDVATDGTLLIKWAQNVSDVSALVMEEDSFIEAVRLQN